MPASYSNASATAQSVAMINTKVYLGTQTTTADNDAFVEIGGLLSIPNFGISFDEVATQTMSQGEIKDKGAKKFGGGQFEFVRDLTDAGQTAWMAASQVTAGNYNLRIIFDNKATSTGTGTMQDIKVKIMGYQEVPGGGPNNSLKLQSQVSFNSAPVKTAAT